MLNNPVICLPLNLPGGSRSCLFNEPSSVTLAMIKPPKQYASLTLQ